MLSQRQLTSQHHQLLITRATANYQGNLLPYKMIPRGTCYKMALELAGKSSETQAGPGKRQEKSKITKIINLAPNGERHCYVNPMVCYTACLEFSMALGTEGGQAMITQARAKTIGRGGIISECCYCL